ncbi:MAG: sugar ABC transporter permease [Anaerolineaceae bacterium]|nr:sugar ABC transporter permease [Anaerolineaceae bacterium]
MALKLARLGKQKKIPDSLPFWLLLPTVLILFIVQIYPTVYTAWLSLQERKPTGWIYVGTKNFERLFRSSLFNESVGHTIVFLVSFIALTMLLGFLTALLLNQKIRFVGFYLSLIFIPWVISTIISGQAFRLLVTPDYGVFAGILQDPALFPPNGISVLTDARPSPWFGSFPFPPSKGMILLVIASTWRSLPFTALLILASLQMIPTEIIESSRIDGANGWQIIRFILVPIILPTLVVTIFNLILTGMNGVAIIISLTGGGPGTSTQIISYLLYSLGWGQIQFSQAAALGLIIAVVNWILILATLRLTKVEEAR